MAINKLENTELISLDWRQQIYDLQPTACFRKVLSGA